VAKVQELGERPVSGENFARIVAARCKVREVRDQQSAVAEAAPLKHARVEGGTERLGKWLHLPVHNDLAPTLASSLDAEVRAMEPTPVFGLLLVRSALTCIEAGRFTMWVDALDSAEDRRRQAALVEVFNTLGLRCRGSALLVHLRDRAVGSAA
jgi:hypothetical protein